LKGLPGTDTNLFVPLENYSRKKFYNIDPLLVVIVDPQALVNLGVLYDDDVDKNVKRQSDRWHNNQLIITTEFTSIHALSLPLTQGALT
jgi:hypothetical protein